METGIPELFGRCRIKKKLGEGAVGTVYLAEHESLGIPVAVKVVPTRLLESRGQNPERFMREARMAARVRHPNVLRVYDCGEEAGYYYLVMDYIDGPTCKERIETEGKIEWREALRIALAAAEGLRCAADAGVIHRDIKPDNIMVDSKGVPQITDLGLAKSLSAAGVNITREEQLLGTPFYMSPEQIRDARYADVRSDIYSLGATLYHMVCGEPPFSGSNIFEIMNKHLREPMPSPRNKVPDLPQALCDVIAKSMAKDPVDRYQKYEEMVADLQRVMAGEKVSAAGAESHLQKGFVPEGETLAKLRGSRVFAPIEVPQPFVQVGAGLCGGVCVFMLAVAALIGFMGLSTVFKPLWGWAFLVVVAAAYGLYLSVLMRPKGEIVGPTTPGHARARIYSLLEMLSESVEMETPQLSFVGRGRPCVSYALPTKGMRIQLSEHFMARGDPTHAEIAAVLARELGRHYYAHTVLVTLLDGPIRLFDFVFRPVRLLLLPGCFQAHKLVRVLALGTAMLLALAILAALGFLAWMLPWVGTAVVLVLAAGMLGLTVRRYSDYSADMFAAAMLADTEPVKTVVVKEAFAGWGLRGALLARAQAYSDKVPAEGETTTTPETESEVVTQIAYYFSRINWWGGTAFDVYETLSGRAFPALRVNALSGLGPDLPLTFRFARKVLTGCESFFDLDERARSRFLPEPRRLRPYVAIGIVGGILVAVGSLVLFVSKASNEVFIYLGYVVIVCAIAFVLGWVSALLFSAQGGNRRELCFSLLATAFALAVCDMWIMGLFSARRLESTVFQIPTVAVLSLVMVSVGAGVALRIERSGRQKRPRFREELKKEAAAAPQAAPAAEPAPGALDEGTKEADVVGAEAREPVEVGAADAHEAATTEGEQEHIRAAETQDKLKRAPAAADAQEEHFAPVQEVEEGAGQADDGGGDTTEARPIEDIEQPDSPSDESDKSD